MLRAGPVLQGLVVSADGKARPAGHAGIRRATTGAAVASRTVGGIGAGIVFRVAIVRVVVETAAGVDAGGRRG